MMNSDQKTAPPKNQTQREDRDWKQLSENILTLALGKSERMIEEDEVDDAAFDRDARDLRLLMSSAEIAARMSRHNEKDRSPHDEQALPREHTEEELDDIFRRVVSRVDELEADEQARSRNKAASHSGRDADQDPQGGCKKGVADPCA